MSIDMFHREAMTPVPLEEPLVAMTTSTGYFHCMNLVQPIQCKHG